MVRRVDDTPDQNELYVGTNFLQVGTDAWLLGSPVPEAPAAEDTTLTPERIIVRSAGRLGMPAYAVRQRGRPTLPSVVFEVSSHLPVDSHDGSKVIERSFGILMRAGRYQDVCNLTDGLITTLLADPSGRVASIGSNIEDRYESEFEFRTRVFSVSITI